MKQVAVRLTVVGVQALGIGGFSGETYLYQSGADTNITVDSPIAQLDYLNRNNLVIESDKFILIQNDEELIDI